MQFKLDKILFFDVETVSQYEKYSDMPKELLKVWEGMFDRLRKRVTDESRIDNEFMNEKEIKQEVYRQTSGLFPEFGKICCVSVGFVTKKGVVKLESFYGTDERDILVKTIELFNKVDGMGFELCGQNIKQFDIPFIGKRCVINGLKPPKSFPTHDSKPWDLNVIDTKEVWSFGCSWGLNSLDLMTACLGVDSPKNGDVKGDQVTSNYYDGNHDKIMEYCERDVNALIDIIIEFNNLD
jgi:hypothetical protein